MKSIDKMMRAALAEGVFPGAVLCVSRRGQTLYHKAFGHADLFARRRMARNTVFDLASLTKPLATTLAVLQLTANGKMGVDHLLGDVLPVLQSTDKAAVSIAQLLSHSAGFTPYRPFYRQLVKMPAPRRQPELRRLLAHEPLVYRPGTDVRYSDIGFMVLQWVIEHCTDKPLHTVVEDEIFKPLGIHGLGFAKLPMGKGAAHTAATHTAATEWCPWRMRLMCGQVHDENTWVVGGSAGQAGLFGSAGDVNRLVTRLMDDLRGRSQIPFFDAANLQRFLSPYADTGKALGFDMPARKGASCGRYFSAHTVGHLGFTGTSFWMDLQREVIVILLTNRVHPSRYNAKIRLFRPRLHDLVLKLLGEN